MTETITQTSGRVAAIYARVSSERQREEGTVQSQLAGLRELAAERGLLIIEELVFCDEGFSGATLTRPALERLRDAPPRARSRWCCAIRRIGLRAATPTRCCCSRSSPAPAWRSCSRVVASGRARLRTSCCASSRG